MPEAEQAEATAKALEAAKGDVKKFSLAPVAAELSKLLGKEVVMAKDVVGPDAKAKAAALKDGEVLMLENVRFHAEETKNDPDFAKALASMAEIYVNDAFGTAHRAHASTAGVADYLPGCLRLPHPEGDFHHGRRAREPEASVRCNPRRR